MIQEIGEECAECHEDDDDDDYDDDDDDDEEEEEEKEKEEKKKEEEDDQLSNEYFSNYSDSKSHSNTLHECESQRDKNP